MFLFSTYLVVQVTYKYDHQIGIYGAFVQIWKRWLLWEVYLEFDSPRAAVAHVRAHHLTRSAQAGCKYPLGYEQGTLI